MKKRCSGYWSKADDTMRRTTNDAPALTRQLFNLLVAGGSFAGFDWDRMGCYRLTEEEVRKVNEICFREK
jgi:hypothetical protein